MERFVRFVVAGGLALVAGLWVAALTAPWSVTWLGGAAVAVAGLAGLAVGIESQVEWR